jgi:hypothetical protein
MGTIVRTRKAGAFGKPIPWTLLDGDGNPEDFSTLDGGSPVPIGRFTVRLKTLPDGTPADSVGTIVFDDAGTGQDGKVNFTPADAEVEEADVGKIQAWVVVDIDGAGGLEIYPTRDEFVINLESAL